MITTQRTIKCEELPTEQEYQDFKALIESDGGKLEHSRRGGPPRLSQGILESVHIRVPIKYVEKRNLFFGLLSNLVMQISTLMGMNNRIIT